MFKLSYLILPVLLLASTGMSKAGNTAGPNLYVKKFGARGDGKTNDTYALAKAFKAAASSGSALVFEPNRSYLIDTITLAGTVSATYKKLDIVGKGATIKSMTKGSGNILSFYYVEDLNISNIKIIGNKKIQKQGSGIGVYYSKNCKISDCTISNCKLDGILIAWVKYATIVNNRIFNNGDGSLPTDGIGVHSLQEGVISCNVVYNNNPLSSQDGDGIQIGTPVTGIAGYYDPKSLKTITIQKNICYLNGRRGIKIQRSNVLVEKNFLSDNAIGVSLVRGDYDISSIKVLSNVIQKSHIGINTDGGGKLRIYDAVIQDNYLLESIITDKILLKDAKNLDVANNSFIRRAASKYGKGNNYFDINAVNTSGIKLDQRNVGDLKLNNTKLFSNTSSASALRKREILFSGTNETTGINDQNGNLLVLDKPVSSITIDEKKLAADYFLVLSNQNSKTVTINIIGSKARKLQIKPEKQLILYIYNNSLKSYSY